MNLLWQVQQRGSTVSTMLRYCKLWWGRFTGWRISCWAVVYSFTCLLKYVLPSLIVLLQPCQKQRQQLLHPVTPPRRQSVLGRTTSPLTNLCATVPKPPSPLPPPPALSRTLARMYCRASCPTSWRFYREAETMQRSSKCWKATWSLLLPTWLPPCWIPTCPNLLLPFLAASTPCCRLHRRLRQVRHCPALLCPALLCPALLDPRLASALLCPAKPYLPCFCAAMLSSTYPALLYPALLSSAMPCPTLPCSPLPCMLLPSPAHLYLPSFALLCPAPAVLCPARPCSAVPPLLCSARPGLALSCLCGSLGAVLLEASGWIDLASGTQGRYSTV